ncbi:MAG: hypothetical protein ACT4PZ_03560 [Panacagrimonas sp.]
MDSKMQMVCTWSGWVFLVLLGVGAWAFAGLIPPPSPAADAATIAEFFARQGGAMRLGLVIAMVSTAFIIPWTAVLSVQMNRMQGSSPVLPLIQAIGGGVAVIILLLPVMLWVTASYRPDRSSDVVLALNDLAWFFILMTFPAPMIQVFAVGIATLADKSLEAVFPRWVGFFNLWMGVLFIPGGLIVFFKSGPFAWNGLIAFWTPFAAFGLWFVVMTPVLLRAIRQQALTPS